MSSRSRYLKAFQRHLKQYNAFHALVFGSMIKCIPTKKMLSFKKELKRRGTLYYTPEEYAARQRTHRAMSQNED